MRAIRQRGSVTIASWLIVSAVATLSLGACGRQPANPARGAEADALRALSVCSAERLADEGEFLRRGARRQRRPGALQPRLRVRTASGGSRTPFRRAFASGQSTRCSPRWRCSVGNAGKVKLTASLDAYYSRDDDDVIASRGVAALLAPVTHGECRPGDVTERAARRSATERSARARTPAADGAVRRGAAPLRRSRSAHRSDTRRRGRTPAVSRTAPSIHGAARPRTRRPRAPQTAASAMLFGEQQLPGTRGGAGLVENRLFGGQNALPPLDSELHRDGAAVDPQTVRRAAARAPRGLEQHPAVEALERGREGQRTARVRPP